MENTLENKAKFFAQYYGQEIAIQSEGGGSGFKYSISSETINDIGRDYLELKPLSAISDEDAIEVAKICQSLNPNSKDGRVYLDYLFLGRWQDVVISPIHLLELFDFLRSRGYLLPFNGLSTETLIQYGWVKPTT